MVARITLLIAVLVLPNIGHTQAYKCRTPSGKVVITSDGCSDGARLEQVTTAAPVTLDQRRQKAEVDSRMLAQLHGIAREQDVYAQQLKQQQASWAVADREAALKKAQEDRAEAQKRCLDNASRSMSDVKAQATAACYGVVLDLPKVATKPVNEPQPHDPLRIIKSCNGNSCSDQTGERYTTTAGKTVRSDGKRCYQQGSAMYCD